MSKSDPIEHEIKLALSSGARLTLLYFSDREMRWIFSHDYVGEKAPGAAPDIVNEVRLTADYAEGHLTPQLVLSMHVVVPSRLGQTLYVGVDISPGAKTYLEFSYRRGAAEYRLVEICKGARDRIRLVDGPALVRPIAFPFPIPDRLPVEHGALHVPFLTNAGTIDHFVLPWSTIR